MLKTTKAQQVTLDLVFAELRKNQLKLTPPRKLIVEALLKNHGPFSAEDLQSKFIKQTCDLATIYRTPSRHAG